jgi:hypothetical protein
MFVSLHIETPALRRQRNGNMRGVLERVATFN